MKPTSSSRGTSQGKSTTTPGTSPRRNSNQRNLGPENPPARRTSEQQRNLTASSSRGTSQGKSTTFQGKKRQGVAQGKKSEGTLVVRRSQARGRMASQPHTNHHARAKADRQTDRTGSNPHTDQTPQRESPPPKDTPWCPRTGPRTREALLCAAPHTALSSSSSSSSLLRTRPVHGTRGHARGFFLCSFLGESEAASVAGGRVYMAPYVVIALVIGGSGNCDAN